MIVAPSVAPASEDKLNADQILARYRVENTAQRMAESVFRQFAQATAALDAVNALLADNVGQPAEIHRALGWIIDGLPALRAVIVVDADGLLLYDSATLPTPRLDLHDRAYFINAAGGAQGRPYIGTPIIGRSSNLPFLAVSRRLASGLVAVGMVNPDSLILPHFRCATCMSAVLSDKGEVLSSVPYGYTPPPGLVGKMHEQGGVGRVSVMAGQLPALLAWHAVEQFGLTVVTTVISP